MSTISDTGRSSNGLPAGAGAPPGASVNDDIIAASNAEIQATENLDNTLQKFIKQLGGWVKKEGELVGGLIKRGTNDLLSDAKQGIIDQVHEFGWVGHKLTASIGAVYEQAHGKMLKKDDLRKELAEKAYHATKDKEGKFQAEIYNKRLDQVKEIDNRQKYIAKLEEESIKLQDKLAKSSTADREKNALRLAKKEAAILAQKETLAKREAALLETDEAESKPKEKKVKEKVKKERPSLLEPENEELETKVGGQQSNKEFEEVKKELEIHTDILRDIQEGIGDTAERVSETSDEVKTSSMKQIATLIVSSLPMLALTAAFIGAAAFIYSRWPEMVSAIKLIKEQLLSVWEDTKTWFDANVGQPLKKMGEYIVDLPSRIAYFVLHPTGTEEDYAASKLTPEMKAKYDAEKAAQQNQIAAATANEVARAQEQYKKSQIELETQEANKRAETLANANNFKIKWKAEQHRKAGANSGSGNVITNVKQGDNTSIQSNGVTARRAGNRQDNRKHSK